MNRIGNHSCDSGVGFIDGECVTKVCQVNRLIDISCSLSGEVSCSLSANKNLLEFDQDDDEEYQDCQYACKTSKVGFKLSLALES